MWHTVLISSYNDNISARQILLMSNWYFYLLRKQTVGIVEFASTLFGIILYEIIDA